MDRQAGESNEFTPDPGGSDLEMLRHLFAHIPKVRLHDLATLSGCGGWGRAALPEADPRVWRMGPELEKRDRFTSVGH